MTVATPLSATLLVVYRRANGKGAAGRAETLLRWDDSAPLCDEIREQLLAYTRPSEGSTSVRRIEWLVAPLDRQVAKGFLPVGFLRGDGTFETSVGLEHVCPTREVISDFIVQMMRARLGVQSGDRFSYTEERPEHEGPLALEVHGEGSLFDIRGLPQYVASGVDLVTQVLPDGQRRVLKDRHGLAASI